MVLILASVFFLLGLVIGSFLNVVICRLNTQRSFGGRSGCMSCQHQLSWYELIPLLSFCVLKGRCRDCKTRISSMYPLVELTTGIVFVALFLEFQELFFMPTSIFAVTYAYYATMFSLLIVITTYDLRHKIIPDILSFIFGALAFVGLFAFINHSFFEYPIFQLHIPTVLEFSSGLLIALPFALLWFFSHGTWMGLGDAKLALGLGWLLGLSSGFSAVVLAFWIGAVLGICLIAFSKKYGMKSEIPFALYLSFGTLAVFIFRLQFFDIIF